MKLELLVSNLIEDKGKRNLRVKYKFPANYKETQNNHSNWWHDPNNAYQYFGNCKEWVEINESKEYHYITPKKFISNMYDFLESQYHKDVKRFE